jgi:hypothetical protein
VQEQLDAFLAAPWRRYARVGHVYVFWNPADAPRPVPLYKLGATRARDPDTRVREWWVSVRCAHAHRAQVA